MGLLDEIGELIGGTIGVVCGIAVAPIAATLRVSEVAVKKAIEAGCETTDEVKEFLGIR